MTLLDTTTLWTAVITPLELSGAIDYPNFEKILRMQEAAGNGVVILGSTGEALNLSLTERESLVNFTISRHLKIPVLVGVGGFDLPGTLEWLEFLEQRPVQGYLMVTPIYSKPGEDGQRRWFETLLNAVTRPCMLYNVPSRAGVDLNFNAVKTLRDHPNFWALKEASGSPEKFSTYRNLLPNQKLFSGDDALMLEFAKRGAQGLVSVSGNLWPEATALYVARCLANQADGLFPLWANACNALFKAANPIPAKALLAHLRIIDSPLVRLPLSHWDYQHLADLITFDLQIKNWFLENHSSSKDEKCLNTMNSSIN